MLSSIKKLLKWKPIWIIGVVIILCNLTYTSINIYKYNLYGKIEDVNKETSSLLKALTNIQEVSMFIILISFIISTWLVIKKKNDKLLFYHAILYTLFFIGLSVFNFVFTKFFSVSVYEPFWAIIDFIIFNTIVLIYSLVKPVFKSSKLKISRI